MGASTSNWQTMKKKPNPYTLLGYLFIAIAVSLAGVIIAAGGLWIARSGVYPKSFEKWFGFLFFDALTFIWVVTKSRHHWVDGVFWITIVSLLLISVSGLGAMLLQVESVRLFWFFLMSIAEFPVIIAITEWTTRKFGKHKNHDIRV
jgi:hypothetical protein